MAMEKPTAETDPNPDQPDPGEPFSKFLQVLRGAVRPIVTLALVGALVIAFLRVLWTAALPQDTLVSIVVGFIATVGTVVGVWFGARNR